MHKNTRYFHQVASAIRRNNKIDALLINGRLIQNQARIKVVIREFYKDLYRQEYVFMIGFQEGMVKKIDGEEATAMKVMLSIEEIKMAVWDCESTKAPGNDGYNMNFIKKCWNEIGKKFAATIIMFFQSAKLPTDAKVISKVLVRKMRLVMPGLVGETQSAFVKGQKIHDKALIACETVQ
ncbi:uncharacterized protein LOC130949319 [Arachis stenosperma]|uniref:uncharacterized protein LOC130949319 n=1 Tax=Arachis stenosperma TaxID=217475 RepID=UPI0025ACEE80|nr:uncharacterized protein LOC130949319 [Arachis stenosperma]